ncbi:methionine--tRNA ligase, cytoplasmic isoform X2 [Helicoverpa zea]|uniref:methionine--tRNA ligase, cytoplasmic isoform X1 n=1 Tax=Helicoverpa zea TaxID=7113 RepID=UPI001F585575|nr:methionine--tRNA ligase, cytoplasmic isoform X1 [Helicoverpa zea]XP_047038247.1 methionine--tRNA ligase, cytoplasmic isoform X2 [Helicoverpa zea]
MKIYTNQNNTSTLKLLIAANLAGKKVDLVSASFEEDTFAGPRQLPLLEVDDNLSFFSSNAAAQYLFPVVDVTDHGECQQTQEWEATHLHPAVSAVLTSKTVASDLKQVLQALLSTINGTLEKHKYILGDKLSPADISIWSTLYPLLHKDELKQAYIADCAHILRWFQDLASAKAVQEAVKQWGGSATGPFGAASALGIPQVPSLSSPVGSPDEGAAAELGPTPEEIEAAKDNWLNGLKKLQAPLIPGKLVLPVKDRKNILITSALPYVNNVPHLGNIIGCVLSADIFARYCRLCDYNTLYISGTDEYGTATETKALEEGITPREICDKYFDIHNSVYRWFNIGFDYFGRTSTPQQTEIAQRMFLKLRDNGFVSSQSVDQLLCTNCDRFLADRFVEGTCPYPGCGYEGARGDQCDKCGKLITATELLQPRCKVCGHTPTVRPSQQLFIELGQLEPSLRTWISSTEKLWSPPARAVSRAWMREPLRSRAVTRDLKWGVPVPVEGFTNKVFYVWFDAPIGYLSITQNATKEFEKWWKPDKEYDVKLYQFMAKDNVPFHCIMFPATLMGVNEGHVLVSHLYATEYLNYEDGKFSKSRGVGVFGTDAQDTGIPSDVWRFYLASIRPETSDSSFSWTELGTRNNSELLNNLGNFCHRSLSFCANSYKGRVPDLELTPADYELIALVNREVIAYVQHMEKGRLREALRHVLSVSRLGNQHMQSQQPWVLLKGSDDDKKRGGTAIGLCCQLVALLCALLSPYLPETVRKLREQLNLKQEALRINPENPSLLQYLPSGHVIGKPEPLFAKIEAEVLDKLRAKYAGTQSERASKENGTAPGSVAELEEAVKQQGEKVRQLKASTKDKSVWQPEVTKLLELKKQLEAAQKQAAQKQTAQTQEDVSNLEKAVAEQANKVRQLKASTKDKTVWQPEVNKLLDLKKQLSTAQSAPAITQSASANSADLSALEKELAEQADKVRKLKASTKDKSVWQPEVNKLLAIKKQLADLQINK